MRLNAIKCDGCGKENPPDRDAYHDAPMGWYSIKIRKESLVQPKEYHACSSACLAAASHKIHNHTLP